MSFGARSMLDAAIAGGGGSITPGQLIGSSGGVAYRDVGFLAGGFGTISPSALAGFTIANFLWHGPFSGGLGNLTLILSGNAGTTPRGATVNGVNLGASSAGVFSSGVTVFTWSNIANPFGTTFTAMPCALT